MITKCDYTLVRVEGSQYCGDGSRLVFKKDIGRGTIFSVYLSCISFVIVLPWGYVTLFTHSHLWTFFDRCFMLSAWQTPARHRLHATSI
jgi:hypothetical protein